MKKILLLAIFAVISVISFAQKTKGELLTSEQIEEQLQTIYHSFDADRETFKQQIDVAEDSTFKKAIYYQWLNMEQRCFNRMYGYVISQEPSEAVLQQMFKLRFNVSKEIVEKSYEKVVNKKLSLTDAGKALKYYINNDQIELGKKYKEIELPSVIPGGKPFKLSESIQDKYILLVFGEIDMDNPTPDMPKSFKAFYQKLDKSSIELVQIRTYTSVDSAIESLGEESLWPMYADSRGPMSPVMIDYNVNPQAASPLCVLIDKGDGTVSYLGSGISDDLMARLLIM